MSIDVRRFVPLVVVVLIVAIGATACTRAIAPIQPSAREAFAAADINRGAELAALGDCVVCHTEPNGQSFAGGRGTRTPFGTVYATNITPDPATGIGRWSLDAFRRAMRDGIDREGRHLYPVLPYPHFIHASDADIAAMYALLMTRSPVNQRPRPNDLRFPFSWRPLLAVWDLLFLKPGEWRPDPARSPEWNRGAYLVDAIGHCGACHTPHNSLGAEQASRTLTGGEAEGWDAPALEAGSPAPAVWTADALTTYLRTGTERGHGAAAGPMAAVTRQLGTIPEADVRAIAVYIKSLMAPARSSAASPTSPPGGSPGGPSAGASGAPSGVEPRAATSGPQQAANIPAAKTEVAAIFEGACAACHGTDAPATRGGAPSLALSTAVRASTARNVVNVILLGLPWDEGRPGPYMPGFAGALTDQQVAELAGYVRARYTRLPAWPDVEATIREARQQGSGT